MAKTTSKQSPGVPRSFESQVKRLNKWREQLNPLRSITMERAINLLEQYQRGQMADLQWAYYFVEQTDADLYALVERRTSSIVEMDWDAAIVAESKRTGGFDEKLAEEQQAAMREAYNGIDNLYDAIEHLSLATFRGFSHLEKFIGPTGQVYHLEPVDQWNVVRDGLRGPWKYNPEATTMLYESIPAAMLMEPDRFIVREIQRHVNRIGFIKYMRSALGEKDWTAFIEIYGIPSGIAIMPANIPAGKEADYQDAAEKIAEGGSGALPAGSDYKTNDGPRGVDPFSKYLDYWSQKLVLAGTGGLLTMLALPGSGTLAGNAHMEVFKKIARAEGRKISEVFQRAIDKDLLNRLFPGKPHLAYWCLSINEETNTGEIAEEVAKLSQAGYLADPVELSEKTGYSLTLKPSPESKVQGPKSSDDGDPTQDSGLRTQDAYTNRAPNSADLKPILRARSEVLKPLATRIAALEKAADPYAFLSALDKLRMDLPALANEIRENPALAQAIFDALSEATVQGARDAVAKELANRGPAVVNVTMPPQPAPVVNVKVPQQKAPQVIVNNDRSAMQLVTDPDGKTIGSVPVSAKELVNRAKVIKEPKIHTDAAGQTISATMEDDE